MKEKQNGGAKQNKAKQNDLKVNRSDAADQMLTTNQGLPINDNQNSLRTGERGATLLEDFILREKITHFDHERIPERVVHARGVGAHGYFELNESMEEYTRAKFLNGKGKRTPVFVRFSTVAGSRGSTDLARDVRGFAVKFYTEEGNYDLVGNNIPIFFIQDAHKFPDLIHSVKPEPNNEIPQAASAHDTFWDFSSLMPESTHMLMWIMSDRAIPRSLRMMEGFGIHTFRFINEAGKATLVKFHFKPRLGVHSVAWDEATKISGKDADFHRRDLWEAIAGGAPAEWDFGVQLVAEEDEHKFEFDLLDPTKIIPEETVPVKIIGKLVLDQNPENYFAETEQVAFCPSHIVPGIDFTNDPLLQGRLFSYLDTQISRLGGPNFHEIPINRAISPVHNNQRDSKFRSTINTGRAAYQPNSIAGGCPFQAMMNQGGFHTYEERVDARKVRARSDSFRDHFSQATLFWNSQSDAEKNHIVNAFSFELSKVQVEEIRRRMVGNLSLVDKTLAQRVADNLGIEVVKPTGVINHSYGADTDPASVQPIMKKMSLEKSAALSMAETVKDTIKTRKVAILAADGVDAKSLATMKTALERAGATVKVIAPKMGKIKTTGGEEIKADESLLIATSVVYDAVFVPDGKQSAQTLADEADAVHFVNEAYRHCKSIAATGAGVGFLRETYLAKKGALDSSTPDDRKDSAAAGVVTNAGGADISRAFIKAIGQHRHWEREMKSEVPA